MALPAGMGSVGPSVTAPPVSEWVRYDPTGSQQSVVVPSGYTNCTAYIIGAGGGQGIYSNVVGASGSGGYTEVTFSVTTGESLKIRVGEGGYPPQKSATPGNNHGGDEAYPGGGNGAWGDTWCAGGGGYSGVFRNDDTPIGIAGGGGGGSGYSTNGGAGGGSSGQGGAGGAQGGSQIAGGSGAYPGSAYQGGNANGGDRFTSTSFDCGGGGGGLFGGAAANGDGSTGAGGSGYVDASATGSTYVGTGKNRPVEVPSTINGEDTTGLGEGWEGVAVSGSEQTSNQGGPGAIWLHFT